MHSGESVCGGSIQKSYIKYILSKLKYVMLIITDRV